MSTYHERFSISLHLALALIHSLSTYLAVSFPGTLTAANDGKRGLKTNQ